MTLGRIPRHIIAPVILSLGFLAGCGDTQPTSEHTSLSTATTIVDSTPPSTNSNAAEPHRVPVVVVGDADWSELMADLYLLSRPDVEVLAIAITGVGMAHCPAGAQNIADVVAAVGSDVPVACGADAPLEGFNAFPGAWRANADTLGELDLPVGVVSDETASDLIASTIQQSAHRVQVLAHGPLTDLATAISTDPLIVANIEMITIMGGAIDVAGNTLRNPNADWNFWIDPEAARDVLNSGAPITLIPLDATNQAPISVFFSDTLAQNRHEKAAEILYQYVLSDPSVTGPGAYFWDPLSAAIMLEPDLASFTSMTIRVLDGERHEQGRTRVDPSGIEVRVAMSVDGEEFQRHFVSTLNDGAKVTSTIEEADATVVFHDQECEGEQITARPTGRTVLKLVNDTNEMTWFAMGTYHEGYGREDLIADSEGRTNLNPPSFVDVVHADEVPANGTTLKVFELLEGTYWAVCLSSPARVDVLEDVFVGSIVQP